MAKSMAGWFKKDVQLETKKAIPGPGTYEPNPSLIKEKTTNIFIGKRYDDE